MQRNDAGTTAGNWYHGTAEKGRSGGLMWRLMSIDGDVRVRLIFALHAEGNEQKSDSRIGGFTSKPVRRRAYQN